MVMLDLTATAGYEVARSLWLAIGVGVVLSIWAIESFGGQARHSSRGRSSAGFDRKLWFSLCVWLLASALALGSLRVGVLVGLGAGVFGGTVFGWLAARRVDSRRVKVRVRKRRRSRVDDAEHPTGIPVEASDAQAASNGDGQAEA